MNDVSDAYPLRPPGAMQMTFMNASLRRSARLPSTVAQASSCSATVQIP